MNVHVINSVLFIAAFGSSFLLASSSGLVPASPRDPGITSAHAIDGGESSRDEAGVMNSAAESTLGRPEYSSAAREGRSTRIVSASSVADAVLAELVRRCEASGGNSGERNEASCGFEVAGISQAAPADARELFSSAEIIARVSDLERILNLEPNLVIASTLGGDRSAARLAETGVNVVNLDPSQGVETLVEQVQAIGQAVGQEQHADDYAGALLARFSELRNQGTQVRGLYVSLYGTSIYGGTRGSSVGDVLEAGGVIDVAEEAGFSGWPELSAEALFRMNPDYIVIAEEEAGDFCELDRLRTFEACEAGQLLRIPRELLSDPGPAMLDAAVQLRELTTMVSSAPAPSLPAH